MKNEYDMTWKQRVRRNRWAAIGRSVIPIYLLAYVAFAIWAGFQDQAPPRRENEELDSKQRNYAPRGYEEKVIQNYLDGEQEYLEGLHEQYEDRPRRP
jgi:uncharacterized membrane protein YukC